MADRRNADLSTGMVNGGLALGEKMAQQVPQTIWDKVPAASQVGSANAITLSSGDGSNDGPAATRPLVVFARDLLGWVTWFYVFVKVFAFDIDRLVVEAVAPQYVWILNYRFLGLLVVLALLAIIWRRVMIKWFLYYTFFPFIVVFWKVPRSIYRRRSWTLAVGLLHVAVASLQSFRYASIAIAVGTLSAVSILVSDRPTLLVLASISLLVLWISSVYRGLRFALSPSRFVQAQRKLLQDFLNSSRMWSQIRIKDELLATDVVVLNHQQVEQLVARAGNGLLYYRVSQFWAYQLDRYRRSNAPILFSMASVAALLLHGVATFAFVNQAVYKIDPVEYSFDALPSLATFIYYSFASIFVSEVAVLSPQGDWAVLLHTLAGFSVTILVIIFIVGLVFGIRQSRTDEAANAEIAAMRREADRFASQLSTEYSISLEDMMRKLENLGWSLVSMLAYLAKEMDRDSDVNSHSS